MGFGSQHRAHSSALFQLRERRLPQLGLEAAPDRCKRSRTSRWPAGTSRAASGRQRKPTDKDVSLLILEAYWRAPQCREPRAWGGSRSPLTVDSINTSRYSTLYFDDPKDQGGLLSCLNHDIPEKRVKIVGCAFLSINSKNMIGMGSYRLQQPEALLTLYRSR